MATIHFPYGKDALDIDIQDEYIGEVILPKPVTPSLPVDELIREALDHPVDCPRLGKIVKLHQRVAILVDDYTRLTPAHRLLPHILQELHAAGIQKCDIQIIFALGTHRPMRRDEIIKKVGEEVARDYPLVNLSASAQSEMVYLGESAHRLPVWVLRAVAEADIRIGLGEIFPHVDAGYSGGVKILFPGVCGAVTIDALHVISLDSPRSQLGMIEAPFRLELERFVCERIPMNFIVNVILDLEGQIYRCVAGDGVAAQRAGIQFAREVYGVPVKQRYPIVIANSYPHQLDFWQSEKGLICGDLVTADGGSLILVTHAEEGNSHYPLFPHFIGMDPDALKLDLDRRRVDQRMLAANGVIVGRMKNRIKIGLVSAGLTQADADRMGFTYYASIEDAIDDAILRLPPPLRKASIGILPQAGITLPIFASDPND